MTIDAEARVVAAESEKKALLIRASAEAQVQCTLSPIFLLSAAQSVHFFFFSLFIVILFG